MAGKMKIKVGQKLKSLRLSAELTQAELADRAQLTKGFISQLENDLVSISLESLHDILEALGVSLQDFFSDNGDEKVVFGPADRVPVTGKGASVFDLLAPGSTNFEMNPMFVTLEPGEAFEEEEAHVGEEFGYVLEGSLTVQFGKKSKRAKRKHCFYFESNQTHRLLNESDKRVSFIWVTAPPLI
jgi:transcriptional regulator with XRE-family HTH domain